MVGRPRGAAPAHPAAFRFGQRRVSALVVLQRFRDDVYQVPREPLQVGELRAGHNLSLGSAIVD